MGDAPFCTLRQHGLPAPPGGAGILSLTAAACLPSRIYRLEQRRAVRKRTLNLAEQHKFRCRWVPTAARTLIRAVCGYDVWQTRFVMNKQMRHRRLF